MHLLLPARLQVAVIWTAFLLSLPCLATDIAVLRNGFEIRHERRVVIGDVTRLYVNADGSSYIDEPTAEIEHFEVEETAPGSGLPGAPSLRRVVRIPRI
jgi:hypothetical protein